MDTLAEIYANNNCIPIKIFKPDLDKYGKSAGVIRNYKMAKYCDVAIVIHNGSKNMIRI